MHSVHEALFIRIASAFPRAEYQKLKKALVEREGKLEHSGIAALETALNDTADIHTEHLDAWSDTVRIGGEGELSPDQDSRLRAALRAMIPWRKGPFSVFGHSIDAEWQSFRKWDRLIPALPDMAGKRIADIGSNNGYYMFRMLAHEPRFVLGLEPATLYWYTWRLLSGLLPPLPAAMTLLGVEHLMLFPESFDIVFFMGVLYHHPSPLEMLRGIHASLRKQGTLILETQGIPGDMPVALFPEERYASVPGTYFVPTTSCTCNLLARAGFSAIEVIDQHPMSSAEQRRTEWMPYHSYADFIDPEDSALTIEGYPAPLRIYVRARK